MLNQRIDIDRVASDKGTERADGFGQGAQHQGVAIGSEIESGQAALAGLPNHAEAMRIIDDQNGVVIMA